MCIRDSKQTLIKQQKELDRLSNTLGHFITEKPDHILLIPARALKNSLEALFEHLNKNDTANRKKLLHSVEEDLLVTLPTSLQRMQTAIGASTTFRTEDLPAPLISRWYSHADEYKIAVYPSCLLYTSDAADE